MLLFLLYSQIKNMSNKNYILSKEAANQKLQRLALEVAEELNEDNNDLIILGIKESGMIIAEKIAQLVKQYLPQSIQVFPIRINKHNPKDVAIEANINFEGKTILLCDDVANSGKTLLYALNPLLETYPKSIQILVLVERSHKRFPVKPDFVGLSLATTLQDNIVVEIEDNEVVRAFVQ